MDLTQSYFKLRVAVCSAGSAGHAYEAQRDILALHQRPSVYRQFLLLLPSHATFATLKTLVHEHYRKLYGKDEHCLRLRTVHMFRDESQCDLDDDFVVRHICEPNGLVFALAELAVETPQVSPSAAILSCATHSAKEQVTPSRKKPKREDKTHASEPSTKKSRSRGEQTDSPSRSATLQSDNDDRYSSAQEANIPKLPIDSTATADLSLHKDNTPSDETANTTAQTESVCESAADSRCPVKVPSLIAEPGGQRVPQSLPETAVYEETMTRSGLSTLVASTATSLTPITHAASVAANVIAESKDASDTSHEDGSESVQTWDTPASTSAGTDTETATFDHMDTRIPSLVTPAPTPVSAAEEQPPRKRAETHDDSSDGSSSDSEEEAFQSHCLFGSSDQPERVIVTEPKRTEVQVLFAADDESSEEEEPVGLVDHDTFIPTIVTLHPAWPSSSEDEATARRVSVSPIPDPSQIPSLFEVQESMRRAPTPVQMAAAAIVSSSAAMASATAGNQPPGKSHPRRRPNKPARPNKPVPVATSPQS